MGSNCRTLLGVEEDQRVQGVVMSTHKSRLQNGLNSDKGWRWKGRMSLII